MELPLEEKRNRVLLTAYELHSKGTRHINIDELGRLSGVGREVWHIIMHFGSGASGTGWLIKSGGNIRFTAEGELNAEKLLKSRMANKKEQVLRRIYDSGGPTHTKIVNISALEQQLSMPFEELNPILIHLDQEELIGAIEHAVWLLPDGLSEVERINKPDDSRPHIIINNPTNSPMSFGANSNQTVNYHGQSTEETIPQLVELIAAIQRMNFDTKEDVLGELEKVQALSQGEMNESKWQLVQNRLLTTKTALEIAQISAIGR